METQKANLNLLTLKTSLLRENSERTQYKAALTALGGEKALI